MTFVCICYSHFLCSSGLDAFDFPCVGAGSGLPQGLSAFATSIWGGACNRRWRTKRPTASPSTDFWWSHFFSGNFCHFPTAYVCRSCSLFVCTRLARLAWLLTFKPSFDDETRAGHRSGVVRIHIRLHILSYPYNLYEKYHTYSCIPKFPQCLIAAMSKPLNIMQCKLEQT